MVILGVADGTAASAALAIDGELVAVESQDRLDRTPRSRSFPWAAIDGVLDAAGLSAEHVDMVAVAGRFSPPFFLRRHPGLYRLVRDAFSPVRDVGVFYQAMLRQSGLGALEADRAADWIQDQLGTRGFRPQRTVLVDVHRALSAVAYRCQPDDDVFAFTLHPMGDGVSVGFHRGLAGQLDRMWIQKGFSALHVHLHRCATAIGLDPRTQLHLLWSAAGRGEADRALVALLDGQLRADGPRLSRRSYPLPSRRDEPVYQALAAAAPEVAAASVLENLRRAVCGIIRHHLAGDAPADVVLSGAVFDNPRLVAAVAALDEVRTVFAEPFGGHGALAVGAAAWVAGLSPNRLPVPGLGREYGAAACERALHTGGVTAVRPGDPAEAVAGLLADGLAVARFHGRAGYGSWGLGTRTVLVRADRPDEVLAVRKALGRPALEEVGCAWLPSPGDGEIRDAAKLGEALRFGNVAVQVDGTFATRYPAVVAPDGRALVQRVAPDDDALLHRTLVALHRRTGCGAVACLPLAEGSEPVVAVPGDALRVWRRTGLAALSLGPYLVQRDDGGGR